MNNSNDPYNEYFSNKYEEKEDEIDLLDLLLVLVKNKGLIISIAVLFICGALIASFAKKPVYQSSTTVFLSRAEQTTIGKGTEYTRTVSTFTPKLITKLFSTGSVINKTKASLPQKEDTSSVALQASFDNKTQLITLTATANAPDLAALAVNYAVNAAQSNLDTLIEDRNSEVSRLENAITLDIANVQKRLSEKEEDLAQYVKKVSPKKEAAPFYSLSSPESSQNAAALFELPDGGLEYLRHLREITLLEDQYHVLQQRKVALSELKRPVSIMALEEAIVPSSPIKPRRSLIVTLAAMLGLFVGVFVAFIREFIYNAKKDPERANKIAAIRKSLTFKK